MSFVIIPQQLTQETLPLSSSSPSCECLPVQFTTAGDDFATMPVLQSRWAMHQSCLFRLCSSFMSGIFCSTYLKYSLLANVQLMDCLNTWVDPLLASSSAVYCDDQFG